MSVLLDFLRLFAAIAVFLGHSKFYWFFDGYSDGIGPQNGQDYVIVFFVLSGFVIAWSIDRKKDYHINQYLFDRLTRLWSIVIPALILGFILDRFGKNLHPDTYRMILTENHLNLKYIISGLFLHESWFFSIRPGSNGPFWSLSYEFFYYFIFGAVALLPTIKTKVVGALTCILIAGPKILLLMPCWLLGCVSYYLCKKYTFRKTVSVLLLFLSGYFLVDLISARWSYWNPQLHEGLGSYPLFYSAKFLDDYILALLISCFLVSINSWLSINDKPSSFFAKVVQKSAGCTFSLYAVHFPFMAFMAALSASGSLPFLNYENALVSVFLLCLVFALFFEYPLKKFRVGVLKILPLLSRKCGIQS